MNTILTCVVELYVNIFMCVTLVVIVEGVNSR